jgi:hypothetical protein
MVAGYSTSMRQGKDRIDPEDRSLMGLSHHTIKSLRMMVIIFDNYSHFHS